MKSIVVVLLIVAAAAGLAGCAAGPNELVNAPNERGTVAGFWLGLWHGFISPVTFLISLFSREVHMYEVHNNGGWYNFGFILGASIILGGGSSARCRRSRRR